MPEAQDTTMNHTRHSIYYLLMVLAMLFSKNAAAELTEGQAAPGFSLPDQNGKVHNLADYTGRWVVLYFYPKDDTPGCTTQACNFRDDIVQLQDLGAEVLGVSLDDTDSHAKFAKKHGLPFPLLADVDAKCTEAYGSLGGMGPVKYAKRNTFIIGPDGKLAKIWLDVKPKEHSDEVIAALKSLQAAR
jgi:peroxiredoxin Q/BCP